MLYVNCKTVTVGRSGVCMEFVDIGTVLAIDKTGAVGCSGGFNAIVDTYTLTAALAAVFVNTGPVGCNAID